MEYPRYKYQRPLSQKRIDHITTLINNGQFLGADISLGKQNGEWLVMDGNHTLRAIIASSAQKVQAVVKKYACDTEEDLARLYSGFNQAFSTRSIKDCMLPHAGNVLKVNWAQRFIGAYASAVAVHKKGIRSKMHIDERTDAFYEFADAGAFIATHVLSDDGTIPTENKFMVRSPIFAVMIGTWAVSQTAAGVFWNPVVTGEDLKARDPRKLYRDFLIGTSIRNGPGANKFHGATEHEFMYKGFLAWNAFRKNKPTILKYFSTKPLPKPI
jgi:hypothetical protein